MSEEESDQRADLAAQLRNLTSSQMEWVQGVINQFQLPCTYRRNPDSDFVTEEVLERVGDALRIHHA